jgi:hypothetical protein
MPKLSINELGSGYTHAVKFDFKDLQTSGFLSTIGAANQRQIGLVAPGGYVDLVTVINTVAEAGSTTLTLDVGITTTDPDEFIDNLDLDALTKATSNTGDALKQSTTGATLPIVGYQNNAATGAAIIMEINPVDSTGVTALTAGEWLIAWRQADIGALA